MIRKLATVFLILAAASAAWAQCPSAPAFPAAVASDATLTLAENNVATTLALAMSSTALTATVANAAGWQPNMLASVDKEVLFVTAVNGSVLTVSRPCEGTLNVSHAAGRPFTNNVTAGSHELLKKELEAVEGEVGANTGPNYSAITGNYDAHRFALGNSSAANTEWGQNTAPAVGALTGAFDAYGAAPTGIAFGVQGAVRPGSGAGVGVIGNCVANEPAQGGCWGGNFVAGVSGSGSYTNIWGVEIDVGAGDPGTTKPASVRGQTIVQGGWQTPLGTFEGSAVQLADLPYNHVAPPFVTAYHSSAGAAQYAFVADMQSYVEESASYNDIVLRGPYNDGVVFFCTDCLATNPCTDGGTGAYLTQTSASPEIFACNSIASIASQLVAFYAMNPSGVSVHSIDGIDGQGNRFVGSAGGLFAFQTSFGNNVAFVDTSGNFNGPGATLSGESSHAGQAACFKSGGQLGYCSTAVGSTGACTCN